MMMDEYIEQLQGHQDHHAYSVTRISRQRDSTRMGLSAEEVATAAHHAFLADWYERKIERLQQK
jgi:hypothetical protein